MSLDLFWDFLSLEHSQQIYFYKVRLSASRPPTNLEDQASVFISPGDRVAQPYPRKLGRPGTSGSPFPVPTYVGPWGVLESYEIRKYILSTKYIISGW
jgi:hypothetical protein